MSITKVHVPLSGREYDISLSEQFFNQEVPCPVQNTVDGRHCLIISDTNVAPLYADAAERMLVNAGAAKVSLTTFKAGEESKNIHTMTDLYAAAVKAGCDRQSVVVALGGGVTGDMAGFLSASYMRGIDYIQIPTSLVAQVDSSIGGKTGIDLPEGKNLVGAFKQPKAVIVDINSLKTLDARQLSCGLGEVIKYGLIMDAPFFDYLEENIEGLLSVDPEVYTYVVKRCCELKADVVLEDELDLSGRRAILNYGHTFGHAVEMLAGYSALTHGESIAIGMMMAIDFVVNRDGHEQLKEMRDRQEAIFKAVNLPSSVSGMQVDDIFEVMKTDKKYEKGKSRLILPKQLGEVILEKDLEEELIKEAIRGRCDQS